MRFISIHLILDIVVSLDLELHQMHVTTAFLNRKLKEEIYIEHVDFISEGQEYKVCRLLRLILLTLS